MSPWLHRIESPLGPIQVAFTRDGAVSYLGFAEQEPRTRLLATLSDRAGELGGATGPVEELRDQLWDYFSGRRQCFGLPLELRGTAFQQRVWAELLKIPYGQTLSYGALAQRLGNPRLSRAVGSANGMNPVSILVPCHRVIGADGLLTGYAGGLGRKRALLELEGRCRRG